MREVSLPAGDVSRAAGARTLGSPVSPAALIVGAVALALILLAFATFPLDRALVASFVAAVLIVVSAIDVQHGVIPDRIVLPAAAIVLVAQIALFPDQAVVCALAAALAAGALLIPRLLKSDWMGMGDVKLALLLGAALGWGVVGAVMLAFLCVLPVALLVILRSGIAARKSTLPFGPFLALGALIVLFGPALAGLPTQ